MGNGDWGMGNGEWRVGNGEWGMASGEWIATCHPPPAPATRPLPPATPYHDDTNAVYVSRSPRR